MKKLLVSLGLLLLPALVLARGGGPAMGGGFHSSGSIGGGFHSSPSVGISGAFRSSSYRAPRSYSAPSVDSGSYYSQGVTNVYNSNSGMNIWFWMWLLQHNNDQKYRNDVVNSQEHFPYVIVVDKTAKDFMLVRYTGPDAKTEKVSTQEADGLAWLKSEINY